MVLLRRPGLSPRPAVLPVASLLLVAGLAAGCGGGDEQAEPDGSSSSSPTAPQVSAADRASAVDEVEAVSEAGGELQQAFDTFDQSLQTYLGGDLADLSAAASVQLAAQSYAAASATFREAADSLDAPPFVVDPEVGAARDAYREQVLAAVDARDAGVGVGFTYISCRQAQAISLLSPSRQERLADTCIESVAPLATNAIPEVAAYAEGVTTLMEKSKRAYASVGGATGQLDTGEGDLLDPDRLDDATEQQEGVNAVARRARDRIDAAYAAFEPTLTAVLDDGAPGPALQARYDASPVDTSQAALLEALQAGAPEG